MHLYYFLSFRIQYKILSENNWQLWLFPSQENEVIISYSFYSKPRSKGRCGSIAHLSPVSVCSNHLFLVARLSLNPGMDSGDPAAVLCSKMPNLGWFFSSISDLILHKYTSKKESIWNMLEGRKEGMWRYITSYSELEQGTPALLY